MVPPAGCDMVGSHLNTIALSRRSSCFKTKAMENNEYTSYEHSSSVYKAYKQYYVYATLFKFKALTTLHTRHTHRVSPQRPRSHKARKANLINVPAMQLTHPPRSSMERMLFALQSAHGVIYKSYM